ncbi:MAG: hypothetical protein D6808_07655, partial [Candidatus Dadabacteria bacterium]
MKRLLPILGGLMLIGALVWLVNVSNEQVPAGYVGYIYQKAIAGHSKFIGIMKGPSSTGWHWRYRSHIVSITPFNYKEEFDREASPILTSDKLRVGAVVNVTWRVHPDKVKDFVERYST